MRGGLTLRTQQVLSPGTLREVPHTSPCPKPPSFPPRHPSDTHSTSLPRHRRPPTDLPTHTTPTASPATHRDPRSCPCTTPLSHAGSLHASPHSHHPLHHPTGSPQLPPLSDKLPHAPPNHTSPLHPGSPTARTRLTHKKADVSPQPEPCHTEAAPHRRLSAHPPHRGGPASPPHPLPLRAPRRDPAAPGAPRGRAGAAAVPAAESGCGELRRHPLPLGGSSGGSGHSSLPAPLGATGCAARGLPGPVAMETGRRRDPRGTLAPRPLGEGGVLAGRGA